MAKFIFHIYFHKVYQSCYRHKPRNMSRLRKLRFYFTSSLWYNSQTIGQNWLNINFEYVWLAECQDGTIDSTLLAASVRVHVVPVLALLSYNHTGRKQCKRRRAREPTTTRAASSHAALNIQRRAPWTTPPHPPSHTAENRKRGPVLAKWWFLKKLRGMRGRP